MNQILVAKTLLQLWKSLPDYEAMLADRAMTHALCSFNTPILTQRIIDRIIDLKVKQQTIHNLSERLNQILDRLPPTAYSVIDSYYQKFGTAANLQKLALRLHISERTFYRQLQNGIEFVARKIPKMEINFFTWQDLLHQHPWIKETYQHLFPPTPPQRSPRRTEPNR